MSQLDRVTIENFKSIRRLKLELKPLNVLIGANGAGKSNFIEAFRLLNQLVEGEMRSYIAKSGGANNILYFGRKTSEEISLRLSFENGVNGYSCKPEYWSKGLKLNSRAKPYKIGFTWSVAEISRSIGVRDWN